MKDGGHFTANNRTAMPNFRANMLIKRAKLSGA